MDLYVCLHTEGYQKRGTRSLSGKILSHWEGMPHNTRRAVESALYHLDMCVRSEFEFQTETLKRSPRIYPWDAGIS